MINIMFRVDGSDKIGSGHVERCINLAIALRKVGGRCGFACRDFSNNFIHRIISQGFEVFPISKNKVDAEQIVEKKSINLKSDDNWLDIHWTLDAELTTEIVKKFCTDLLVVDHYSLDYGWENLVRPYCKDILVIDDLCDRVHNCDFLIDSTFQRNKIIYKDKVPKGCNLLIGSSFTILNTHYLQIRPKAIERRNHFNELTNVLISYGGGENSQWIENAILAIKKSVLAKKINLHIILGNCNTKNLNNIFKLCEGLSVTFEKYCTNMPERIFWADLAIGAGGTTSWERCCLGLPSIITPIDQNQFENTMTLMNCGAAIRIEIGPDMVDQISQSLEMLLIDHEAYHSMSYNASLVCDGQGTSRILEALKL